MLSSVPHSCQLLMVHDSWFDDDDVVVMVDGGGGGAG